MTPVISLLMPAYDRQDYIAPSIESVLAQTYGDWELIIVDDCSHDDTVQVAKSYEARDSRIRVVACDANLGQFANRNRALKYARGPLVKFHDSDDILYPHCLATMASILESEPAADFALTSGWNWPGGPCPMLLTPRLLYQREFLGSGIFFAGPSCGLFRRHVFDAVGGFPELGVGSDSIFWLRTCAKFSAVLTPADLFWYRVHPDQEFQSTAATLDYTLVARESWQALNSAECPLQADELVVARRNLAWLVARNVYRDLRANRWNTAWIRFRRAGLTWREWAVYLRRQRRKLDHGTPLDRNGQYLVPAWVTKVQGESDANPWHEQAGQS